MALLRIFVAYIKENITTKLQKLYSSSRNLRAVNKSPALVLKKTALQGGFIAGACKMLIKRPAVVIKESCIHCSKQYIQSFIRNFTSTFYVKKFNSEFSFI